MQGPFIDGLPWGGSTSMTVASKAVCPTFTEASTSRRRDMRILAWEDEGANR